jgi:hypothetical protein
MAWAVLVYTLVVVLLYFGFEILLPSSLRKRGKRPHGDMARAREDK